MRTVTLTIEQLVSLVSTHSDCTHCPAAKFCDNYQGTCKETVRAWAETVAKETDENND